MKAQELRIGNLLKISNKIGNLISVLENDVLKISVNSNTNISAPIERFDPIPLTEEWLLKFGFEYTRILCGFNQYRNKILELSITPNGYEIFFTYKWINIKYVHQLQNLYFALTGEELTIKN